LINIERKITSKKKIQMNNGKTIGIILILMKILVNLNKSYFSVHLKLILQKIVMLLVNCTLAGEVDGIGFNLGALLNQLELTVIS